jgi:MSHA biogenesis protein MshQ
VLVAEDQAAANQGVDLGGRLSSVTPPPSGWVSGQYIVSAAGAIFSRPVTPLRLAGTNGGGPYDSLNVGLRAVDGTAVVAGRDMNASTTGTCVSPNCDAKQIGSATSMRYGMLKLDNAYGSEVLNARVPVRAMYIHGFVPSTDAPLFALNSWDNACTSIAPANIALGNQTGPAGNPLSAANFGASHLPGSSIVLANGAGTVVLTKPSPVAVGSADIAINLGATTTDSSCVTWNPSAPSTTGANLAWLRRNWCGVAGYVRDPNARVSFGNARSAFIYRRERY